MIKLVFDHGRGSNNSTLYIHFGAGKGYMNNFWVALNKGPGDAVKPKTPCGHTGIYHCNSVYCTRKFCNLPENKVIGFFLRGHTLTLMTGAPFYKNDKLLNWLKNSKLAFQRSKQVASFK